VTPTHRVSIRSWKGATLRFHSSALRWIPRAVEVPRTLRDNLNIWGNPSLWKTLRIDGDDCSWIFRGLMRGSLFIGHDGSYMPMVANDVCSCAVVLHCTQEDTYAEVTWVERSTKHLADNYCVEILRRCCAQKLIVKAAVTGRGVLGLATLCFGCDKMGVLLHGTYYRRPLLEKQAQSDVLRYFKQLISESRIGCTMVHVHGHMDKQLRHNQLTPLQRVNIRADELASSALMVALATQIFIKDLFPSEGVKVSIGTKRITGSPKAEITHLWGEQVAQELFYWQGIVHRNNFPLVYWEGTDKVMRGFPEPFRVWITKHVSHFDGMNRILSWFPATETRAKFANKCPYCGCTDKSTAHITRCHDKGRTLIFLESITSLIQWLRDQQTDPEVVHLFRHYLSGRGTRTMASLLGQPSQYCLAAEYHD
jgi:hypothetical protein